MNEQPKPSGHLSEPRKEQLWGWWHSAKTWQNALHRSASYKALDIPEEMGDIEANKSIRVGMTWKELAVLGGLALGGLYLWPSGPTMPTPTELNTQDYDWEISHWEVKPDGSRQLIDVERVEP